MIRNNSQRMPQLILIALAIVLALVLVMVREVVAYNAHPW